MRRRRVGCLCFAEVGGGRGGGGVGGGCAAGYLSVVLQSVRNYNGLMTVLSVAASSPPVVYIWVTSKYPTGQGTIGSTEGSPIVP